VAQVQEAELPWLSKLNAALGSAELQQLLQQPSSDPAVAALAASLLTEQPEEFDKGHVHVKKKKVEEQA
jgi:hypothetical protein